MAGVGLEISDSPLGVASPFSAEFSLFLPLPFLAGVTLADDGVSDEVFFLLRTLGVNCWSPLVLYSDWSRAFLPTLAALAAATKAGLV